VLLLQSSIIWCQLKLEYTSTACDSVSGLAPLADVWMATKTILVLHIGPCLFNFLRLFIMLLLSVRISYARLYIHSMCAVFVETQHVFEMLCLLVAVFCKFFNSADFDIGCHAAAVIRIHLCLQTIVLFLWSFIYIH